MTEPLYMHPSHTHYPCHASLCITSRITLTGTCQVFARPIAQAAAQCATVALAMRQSFAHVCVCLCVRMSVRVHMSNKQQGRP